MIYPKIKIIGKEDALIIDIEEDQMIDTKGRQLDTRTVSNLENKSFYLPMSIGDCHIERWVVAQDDDGHNCLIPLKKKEE